MNTLIKILATYIISLSLMSVVAAENLRMGDLCDARSDMTASDHPGGIILAGIARINVCSGRCAHPNAKCIDALHQCCTCNIARQKVPTTLGQCKEVTLRPCSDL